MVILCLCSGNVNKFQYLPSSAVGVHPEPASRYIATILNIHHNARMMLTLPTFLWLIRVDCILLRANNRSRRRNELRWHEKNQLSHSPRAFLTNPLDKHQRKKTLCRSSKKINPDASHETSKAKTWDEIKSFPVLASVYLRSWRFTRAKRAYQRCGKLLSFQHKNPARSETWEYFWKSFEMRDLNGEVDAEKAFYDVIMRGRGRGRTYRVEDSKGEPNSIHRKNERSLLYLHRIVDDLRSLPAGANRSSGSGRRRKQEKDEMDEASFHKRHLRSISRTSRYETADNMSNISIPLLKSTLCSRTRLEFVHFRSSIRIQ